MSAKTLIVRALVSRVIGDIVDMTPEELRAVAEFLDVLGRGISEYADMPHVTQFLAGLCDAFERAASAKKSLDNPPST